jgi:hypothetical protein
MDRIALTFAFAIASLLGQGVCCCSFASSRHLVNPAPTDVKTIPTAKPVKSCCQQEALSVLPCSQQDKPNSPKPGNPSKCPCKHDPQAKALPPGGHAPADPASQLKLMDTLFVGLAKSLAISFSVINSASADPSPQTVKFAGRDLLAVYSMLRC